MIDHLIFTIDPVALTIIPAEHIRNNITRQRHELETACSKRA